MSGNTRSSHLEAHRLKCKGITIYGYGSKSGQVLSVGEEAESRPDQSPDFVAADQEYAGGCVGGLCDF